MRAIVKTFTYLIIDMLTHSVIVYTAGHFFGYNISIASAGIIGVIIEAIETAMYYLHEVIWDRIKWGIRKV